MAAKDSDKRRFQRIHFDAPCELHYQESVWTTEVLDISLKGVLVKRPEAWTVPLKQPCEVTIHLDDHDVGIVMAVELRHVEEYRLGFTCKYIDIESAGHLRRLVELNLGDQMMLERELSRMIGE